MITAHRKIFYLVTAQDVVLYIYNIEKISKNHTHDYYSKCALVFSIRSSNLFYSIKNTDQLGKFECGLGI